MLLDIRDKLRVWREENVRQSSDIITMWDTVLQDKINKLGDESKLCNFKASLCLYPWAPLMKHMEEEEVNQLCLCCESKVTPIVNLKE